MTSVQQQRILITGVSRGVGLEMARLFLAEGAEVVGVARDPGRLDDVRRTLGYGDAQLDLRCVDLDDGSAGDTVAKHIQLDSMKTTGIPTYRLSKWALNGLTMLLAKELQGKIAVNAFDPGWVKTDMGGPNAPGQPTESAQGALALLRLPISATGKFWKDGKEIPF